MILSLKVDGSSLTVSTTTASGRDVLLASSSVLSVCLDLHDTRVTNAQPRAITKSRGMNALFWIWK